jgi:tryptophan-rich sensory protein
MEMKRKSLLTLLICLLFPLVIGSISSLANVGNLNEWYVQLNKPSFNPPGYLFGPVWTVLYLLMGLSFYLIWKSPGGKIRTRALTVFGFQMLLNFAWSFIFFYFRQTGWGLVEIIILWLNIILMILVCYKINKTAALIQIPYLLWVSFASVLNATIWMLNK